MTREKSVAERDETRGYTDADLAEVSDNPEWTAANFAAAQPFAAAFPEAAASIKRRGPQKAPTKASVTLRLDRAVLEHFKAGGRGWQVRMGEALKKVAGV